MDTIIHFILLKKYDIFQLQVLLWLIWWIFWQYPSIVAIINAQNNILATYMYFLSNSYGMSEWSSGWMCVIDIGMPYQAQAQRHGPNTNVEKMAIRVSPLRYYDLLPASLKRLLLRRLASGLLIQLSTTNPDSLFSCEQWPCLS